MQRIDLKAVKGATTTGNVYRPHAVGAICPYCREKVTYSLVAHGGVGPEHSVAFAAACPSCNKHVGFWSVNSGAGTVASSPKLYMHPTASGYFPLPEEVDQLPQRLRQSFVSTVESYNAGIYPGAAVMGRRTLEGIFQYLLPETKRNFPLAKLIDAAIQQQDLAAPLRALSHAIRSGGNLGAHFDMEHEPDEAVARQMVELLAYLISYLYVLPNRIKTLETQLSKAEV